MHEIAIFDLDGTLIDLEIDTTEFERHRSSWARYLTSRGIATNLKPLLPELQRVSQIPLGRTIKADILRTFDDIERTCPYRPLGRIDAVLSTFKANFRRLVIVTHNSLALWIRLTQENTWTRLVDQVITRDEMNFFKPDPRVCESVFNRYVPSMRGGECWVIGNSEADRGLGLNLRRIYSNRAVRIFIINPTSRGETRVTGLDMELASVDSLLNLPVDIGANILTSS
jgi:FMN phosphatase YigB (HAD superfamily)